MYRIVDYECVPNAECEFYVNSASPEFTVLVLLVNQEKKATKVLG